MSPLVLEYPNEISDRECNSTTPVDSDTGMWRSMRSNLEQVMELRCILLIEGFDPEECNDIDTLNGNRNASNKLLCGLGARIQDF